MDNTKTGTEEKSWYLAGSSNSNVKHTRVETQEKLLTYTDLDNMSWYDTVEAVNADAKFPLSVHAPLNYPCATKIVHLDCGMNAVILETPKHMNAGVWIEYIKGYLQNVRLISFAMGQPAFVPDFRQVKLSRKIGGLPIFRARFAAWNLVYTADYCIAPGGSLHIRFTVRNESSESKTGTVWVRPSRQLERDIFKYHYVGYSFNATQWKTDTAYCFEDNLFADDKGLAGKLTPGDFTAEWMTDADFTQMEHNTEFGCEEPYYVADEFKLGKINNILKLENSFRPGEEKSFELTFRTDSVADSYLDELSYDDAEKAAVDFWRKNYLDSGVKIDLGNAKENSVLEAIRLVSLQLLLDAENGTLQPCQGGTSERFYVWVWEAMSALEPMVRLGYFKEVRKVIEFIFSNQDGGWPPVGKFTSLKGAIGTSGPKWANSTGAALLLASEYLMDSEDMDFREKYLDKMMAAARWITGEVKATRVPGNPTYGIFPPACGTDADYGQMLFTDMWTLGGLIRFVKALKSIGHPDALEFQREAEQYKHDLEAAIDRCQDEDGYIPRTLGDATKISHGFRFNTPPMELCTAGVESAADIRMMKYREWFECNAMTNGFCGTEISTGIYYIGNNEATLMKMYLELGLWKRAWAAARTFRRYVVTPDLYLTQERYSSDDTSFTPWQPNASNNGRFLDLQISRFIYTPGNKVILYGGFNPGELEHCPSFNGIMTKFGKTDIAIRESVITLTAEKEIPAGTEIITQWSSTILDAPTNKLLIPCN